MKGRLLTPGLAWTIISFVLFNGVHAGGPDFVQPGGEILKWREPVPLMMDQGPLGNLSNSEAIQLVLNAVQSWQEVESSTIAFSIDGSLSQDINTDNYEMFLGGQSPNVNPIIFDHDGGIIDDFLGTGSSSSVLGFAGLRILDPDNLAFRSGWAVLNGKRASGNGTFPQVVTHELGHMIGLDHTQGLTTNTAGCGSVPPSGQFCEFIPMMYPLIFEAGPNKPIRDDIAWVSWLYPAPQFRQQTGTITGKIVRRTGSPLFNANVVAIRLEDSPNGLAQSNEEFVSVVSDFLLTEDGSYEIPGLVPGKYAVFVEPVQSSFVNGSGVGPRDFRYSDFSKEFWNEDESGDASEDNANLKTVIEVKAGETVSDINVIVNEEANRPDKLTDDDEMLYLFPDGFTFPFYGKTYSKVVINSDGNLTFTRGDSSSTPRSEERFLSGPPRIAPFFSDLNPGFGTVLVVENPASLEFIWEEVPEYSSSLGTPGNTFSVTLYRTGDIRFHYEKINATPDPDSQSLQGLIGIVGITPGGGTQGSSQSLSSGSLIHEIGEDPIYQTFAGSSFNLVGQEVLFQASSHEIYFPFYTGNNQLFTGFAVNNFGEEAEVQVENYQFDGTLATFPFNPGTLKVPAGGQLAQLGAEIFGATFSTEQKGWVRMRSSSPQLASFFQFGNGLSGDLTKMDGGISQTETSSRLIFTRVHQGANGFRTRSGFLPAVTLLSIVNPGLDGIELDLRLYSNSGSQLSRVSRDIAPLGVLKASVAELFGVQQVNDGFIEVDVDGGEATGFQVVELADTLLGLNALFPHENTVSYSAQLGHGPAIFTSLKLVNPTDFLISVTLTAFLQEPQGGVSERVFGPVVLSANQTFQRTVDEIFGLLGEQVGSIRIESSQPGIVGDVVFGEPLSAEFAAAISLQTVPFTKAVFSQVANGTIDPLKPSLNSFTGIALFNPNEASAQVQVEVFDRDGGLVGETTAQLAPGQRLSEVLENLIPSTEGLIRGYIIVTASQPIVAQQLLGNKTLQYLSAVPPTVIDAP